MLSKPEDFHVLKDSIITDTIELVTSSKVNEWSGESCMKILRAL